MSQTQQIQASEAINQGRSVRNARDVRWWQEPPHSWKDLVVVPVNFDIFQEYEIAAERIIGYDANSAACYSASRYLLTELMPDDDEEFYETPTYAELLTAWRLRDKGWLVFHSVAGNGCFAGSRPSFTLSESMPR